MGVAGHFANSGVREILAEKDSCAAHMVSLIIGACLYSKTESQEKANYTDVHRIHSNMVFLGSKNFDRECSMTEIEELRSDIFALNHKALNIIFTCLHVRTIYARVSHLGPSE